MPKINHIADFESLGGVQTYLYSLKKKYPNFYSLYNLSNKVLDIYKENPSYNFTNIFSLKFFLEDQKNNFFVVHNLILSKKWIFIKLILKLKNCKIIYHEHGIAWHKPSKNKIIYKRRIEKIEKIIVNSNATKILLNSFYDIKKNVEVLSSPVCIYEELNNDIVPYNNINKTKKLNSYPKREEQKLIIGFIGRLEEHKNPQFLIELAKIFNKKYKREIEIEFIGSGALKKNLKIKCLEENIKATFWGRVFCRRDRVNRWDFCIVPSIREPLGLVPGEMALLDVVTLASNVDGLNEMYPSECDLLLLKMIKDNTQITDNYQYIPDQNSLEKGYWPCIDDCAKKINLLIENKEKKYELLKKHRDFIFNNFDILKHSKKLFNFVSSN